MNPGTLPGFPRSHRLCEEPPTRGTQPTRLELALIRSAGWTAARSAHSRPRGWGLHSPAWGPLCPHASRKREGRRRISKPTGQPQRAGLCPPSTGAAGEAPVSWGRGPGTAGWRGQGAARPPRGLHTAQRSPAHPQAPHHFLSHQQTPWPTVSPREPEALGANRQGSHGLGHRPLAPRAGRGEPGAALSPPQDCTRAKPLSHLPQKHPWAPRHRAPRPGGCL